jgi:hypothetical protein
MKHLSEHERRQRTLQRLGSPNCSMSAKNAAAAETALPGNSEGWKCMMRFSAVIAPRRSAVRVRLAPSREGLQK